MIRRVAKLLRLPTKIGKRLRARFEKSVPEPEQKLQSDARAYWSSSDDDPTKQDLSHWRGSGRWQEDTWLQVGDHHFRMYQMLRGLAKPDAIPKSMLEWGPGGGANAVRFAADMEHFHGVDISPANLEECGRQMSLQNNCSFHPHLVDVDHPELVLEDLASSIDFFLCTAVYQHFPSKDYGLRITRIASQLLSQQGLALIQTRYDSGQERFRSKVRNYAQNAITFTSYRVEEFWELLEANGLEPLAVQLEPKVHYAYYCCRRSHKTQS